MNSAPLISLPKRLPSLRYWAVLAWLVLGISGCALQSGGGGKNLRSEHVQTWVGEVSCPGCSERWLAVTLFPDGLFRLRESYVASKGGAEERFYDVGRWSATLGDARRLLLKGASQRQFRLLPQGDLVMLDEQGNDIVSIREYVLKRQPKPDLISDEMRLLALYSEPANSGAQAMITECLSAQVLPLADSPAAAKMLQHIQTVPADRRARGPVLAALTAQWQEPTVKSSSVKRALNITAFERFWPNETCAQGPIAPAHPLQETVWRLSSIKGVAAQEAVLGQAAHIRLRKGGRLTGTTGCNRLQGTWQLSDNKLSLSRMSSTRAYCRDAMAQQERALMEVLRESKQYRQVGHQLELLQGDQVLARFVATEMM